jgi:hypothetical protein
VTSGTSLAAAVRPGGTLAVVNWVEIFAAVMVAHLVGDFLLQTEWQALNKHGGLGRDPVKRRALLSHVATYAIPFIPVLIWVGHHHGTGMALIGAAIVFGTHLVQDDGRLLVWYIRTVKKTSAPFGSPLWMSIDQSLHVAVLFAAALLTATG